MMVSLLSLVSSSRADKSFYLPPCLQLQDRLVAERSMLIVNMMEDLGDSAGAEVPIPNVS